MCSTDTPKPKAKPLPVIPPYGEYSVEVENLTFGYSSTNFAGISKLGDNLILNNLNLKLPTGSRCLLIGANGTYLYFLFSLLYTCFLYYFTELTSLSIFSKPRFGKIHTVAYFGWQTFDQI